MLLLASQRLHQQPIHARVNAIIRQVIAVQTAWAATSIVEFQLAVTAALIQVPRLASTVGQCIEMQVDLHCDGRSDRECGVNGYLHSVSRFYTH
jgi:hypothetical protein